MMNRFVRSLALLIPILVLACLCSLQGLGQARGTISGTVMDATGAVIPGASVTATQITTQIAQRAVSGSSGVYAIPNLAVGTYIVSVKAAGFKTGTVKDISLDVSQTRTIDITLSPGAQTESVEVAGEAPPLMNTTNATLAGLVTEQQVSTLPLNGREIENLVMLQPGVVQDPGGIGWMEKQFVGNGNRAETSVITLDGADASNTEFGTISFYNFNLDAIAEFKVLQGNFSAEFGSGGGTITQMVSKEGGNDFHGSAFEFVRNNDLDATNYFAGPEKSFQKNEFGGTVGGPIVRRKLFFFGEYAGLRLRQASPQVTKAPTDAQKSGQVAVSCPAVPATSTTPAVPACPYDGYTYQVPVGSVAAQVFAIIPKPNDPTNTIYGYGPNTLDTSPKQPTDTNQWSVRIDHHISDRDFLFGRASFINNTSKGISNVTTKFNTLVENSPRNFALSETHNFTPALTNTATLSTQRELEGQQLADLSVLQTYSSVNFSDGSLSGFGPNSFYAIYANTFYSAQDKLTWSMGRHLLSAGIVYRYGDDNGVSPQMGANGSFTFSPGATIPVALPSTNGGPTIPIGTPSPNSLISFLLQIPASYNRGTTAPGFGPAGGGPVHWGIRSWRLETYLQDDYKVTPKFTLNLGVRYEYYAVPYEIRDRIGAIEPLTAPGSLAGQFIFNPSSQWQQSKLDLSPRVGFAYNVSNNTVVRGGAALLTNNIPTTYADQAATDFPMSANNTITATSANPITYTLGPGPVTFPQLYSLSGTPMPPNGNPQDIPHNTPINLAPATAILGRFNGWWTAMNLKDGYTYAGNLTVEQKLPGDMALQATFVTSHAMKLMNEAYPNAFVGAESQYTPYTVATNGALGELALTDNEAISHYNALQVQARKISPLHGLQFQANYTWASDLSDADSVYSDYSSSGGVTPNDPTNVRGEYGRAHSDVKHRIIANFSYAVPGRWGLMPQAISKGWQLLGIYSMQSGFPFSVVEPYGTLQYGFDYLNYFGGRPSAGQKVTYAPKGSQKVFSDDVLNNPGAYFVSTTAIDPLLGNSVQQTAPGNLGRNTFNSPSWWNTDFSMVKDTKLFENVNFQFRAEFFNIFNHTTYASPNSTVGYSNFGLSTSTMSNERQIQFGGRFTF